MSRHAYSDNLDRLAQWIAESWTIEVERLCSFCGLRHYSPGTMTRRWGRWIPAQACRGDGGDSFRLTLKELSRYLRLDE